MDNDSTKEPTVQEKATLYKQKMGEMGDFLAKHTKEGKLAMPQSGITEFNQRNDELADLKSAYDDALRIAQAKDNLDQEQESIRRPVNGLPNHDGKSGERQVETKTLGQRLIAAPQYKQRNGAKMTVAVPDVDLKTLMTTDAASAGYPPEVLRSGVVVPYASAQPTLMDLIPMIETTQHAYKYIEQTVRTNTAAETAEGGAYNEATIKYEEKLVDIHKITVFVPLTDEQLADEPGFQSLVDDDLTLMLKQRLNSQIVNGNGTAPNLLGLYNVSGILNQPISGDTKPDAVYKAMVKIMTQGFADPSNIFFNPLDWQDIRLTKTTTNAYLFGDPDTNGVQRLFGLPFAQHVSVAQGTPVVFDRNFVKLVYRAGIELEVSNSHADFFAKGQLAIRAQMRVTLVTTRGKAVTTVSF